MSHCHFNNGVRPSRAQQRDEFPRLILFHNDRAVIAVAGTATLRQR